MGDSRIEVIRDTWREFKEEVDGKNYNPFRDGSNRFTTEYAEQAEKKIDEILTLLDLKDE